MARALRLLGLAAALIALAMLALSGPLFDGLYEYRKRALLSGRNPA